MYDTASVLLSPVPAQLAAARAWERVLTEDDPRTGERHVRRILNTHQGLHLTLVDDARLVAERSLPKALTGQNIRDLEPDELPAAIRAVDAEIATMLRAELPSVAAWQPVRVDYCRSQRRASEAAVLRELRDLADVELPYKGRPVRGDAGAVSWPKGYLRPKAYSKFLESGKEEARGILRFEVGVFRLRAFRRLLASQAGTPVALRDVLTPAVHGRVMSQYEDRLWRVILSEAEIGDARIMVELVRTFGMRRATELIGWCCIWALMGKPSLQHVALACREMGTSRASMYRAMADLREFRKRVAELEGRPPAEFEAEVEALAQKTTSQARKAAEAEAMAHRLALLRRVLPAA